MESARGGAGECLPWTQTRHLMADPPFPVAELSIPCQLPRHTRSEPKHLCWFCQPYLPFVSRSSSSSRSITYPFPCCSGVWPTGTAFQVNLVKSTTEISSILVRPPLHTLHFEILTIFPSRVQAQSDMFNITGSASSSSSSSSAASSSASTRASSSSAASSSTSAAATVVQSGASAVYSGNAQSTAVIPVSILLSQSLTS